MINIQELDKNKTYIGYQIGRGAVARAIQKKSKMLMQLQSPSCMVSSHVFALVYKDDRWWIYESHLRSGGVAKIPFVKWIKEEIPDANFVFEYPLSIFVLDFYARFNPGYSLGAIGKIAFSSLADSIDDKDSSGMICSEYISIAIPDFKPCFLYNTPPWEVLPYHIQSLEAESGF